MITTDADRDVLRPRRRRAWPVLVASLLALAIAAAVVTAVRLGRPQRPATAAVAAPATATVTRTTLTQVDDVDGTLGYPTPLPVTNRLQGTVTGVAAAGRVVRSGQALYAVDTQPVILLYGSLPAYRTLEPGSVGSDVYEFERNLADLGYGGFTVDDIYTGFTADAVRQWQYDLGLPQTGTVALGQVIFMPGPVRVATAAAQPGQVAAPGQTVLTVTANERIVTADVDSTDMPLIRAGGHVTVTLPDGMTVSGTISGVGTTAIPEGQQQNAGATASAPQPTATATTIPVIISVTSQRALGTLTGAPVTVGLTGLRRSGVLAVPVAALLALRGGGYGLEVISGTAARVVTVQVGLFASGMVEVSGAGITPGTRVGMAAL